MSREALTFPTQDEAIAEALHGAAPGDLVEVHEAECEGREEPNPPYDVIGCTCEPLTLTVGAKA